MLRFGLCCKFRDQPIHFATTTATSLARLPRADQLAKLSRLCLANGDALLAALTYCANVGIGCFRINSQLLPLKTHPQQGYAVADLPDAKAIVAKFKKCGEFVRANDLRTCFHPDQFVVLNSPRPEVVASSIAELEYQGEASEWVAADVINIHGGGAYGDKAKALRDFASNLNCLSNRVRKRLTVENDDKTYTPADLFPICRAENLPLVYDVHHHRCRRDGLSVAAATSAALNTWGREPLFHVSSPIAGWKGQFPERHHDFINPKDFPKEWLGSTLTVEVEAKAKEAAVLRLMNWARRKSETAD